MLEIGLVVSRCVHYTALLALFGVALFPLYALKRPVFAWTGARRANTILSLAAALGAVSGVVLLGHVAAGMVGSWSELHWDGLVSVAVGTIYGRIWIAHIALAGAITAVTLTPRALTSPTAPWVLTLLSGLLLASLALVGHAQDGDGATRLLHMAADALHLLAAGAWLGGIVALFDLLHAAVRGDAPTDGHIAIRACVRFAGLGMVAVATLIVSGMVNTWLLVGTVRALFSTPYGQLLVSKLVLFGAMLLLAALNRFKLVPGLLASNRSSGSKTALVWLRRHVGAEQALGLLIILIVSALGTMEPATSAMQSTVLSSDMQKVLGNDGPKEIAIATVAGAASSGCSYAQPRCRCR